MYNRRSVVEFQQFPAEGGENQIVVRLKAHHGRVLHSIQLAGKESQKQDQCFHKASLQLSLNVRERACSKYDPCFTVTAWTDVNTLLVSMRNKSRPQFARLAKPENEFGFQNRPARSATRDLNGPMRDHSLTTSASALTVFVVSNLRPLCVK